MQLNEKIGVTKKNNIIESGSDEVQRGGPKLSFSRSRVRKKPLKKKPGGSPNFIKEMCQKRKDSTPWFLNLLTYRPHLINATLIIRSIFIATYRTVFILKIKIQKAAWYCCSIISINHESFVIHARAEVNDRWNASPKVSKVVFFPIL